SERPRLERLAESLGAGGIHFAGSIAPEAMPALLDHADVFLNSSTLDNQPVSVLEAFAAGLPVISTPAGDIGAMVSDRVTGLLVDPDDPAAMASAVASLAGDPALAARLAGNALARVMTFSWPRVRDA